LLDAFPKDELVFVPQVSSVQLAFARIKESWHDACVVSLHGRPMTALLPALRQGAAKIAVLTDAQNHPAAIASFLSAQGLAHYTLWVCEELGGPGERVTCWTPESIQQHTFSPLNVTVLLRHATPATSTAAVPLLGIPEAAIRHRQGMITKREIRLLTLGYLALRPGDVLWDIGAGSGSVSLEAARLSPSLEVFALERSTPAYEHVMHNVGTFALPNVHPVLGEAPAALASLPNPDAVFIGGSGGRLEAIMAVVVQRLKPGGRIVMNCITLENFSLGWDLLRRHTLQVDTTAVQLSYAQPLGQWHRLEADSPIFILRATKP
jgi:precorrin-6Y C5,15-methyltransferase (decarboxylating)